MPGRIVYMRGKDDWVEKRNDSTKGSVHKTQGAAMAAARVRLAKEGGGELTIKGEDGKIRRKITVPPGKDPFPPRG
jgi:hypothetical protein